MNTQEFLAKIQDYFGGQYTQTQFEAVAEWCERKTNDRIRKIIYRYVIETMDTKFKSPPTVKRLNEIRAEVAETYPELSASGQRPSDVPQIEEGAGYDPGNLWEKIFEKVAERKGVSVEDVKESKRV